MRVEEADRIAFRFGLGPARSEDWSAEGLVKIASNVDKRTLRLDVKQRFKEITDYESRRRSAKTSGAQSEVNMEISRYYNYAYQSDLRERVKWAAQVDHPFLDRLLAFWSNHFSISYRKFTLRALVGPFEADAIAKHMFGYFNDLLLAAETHPAMLIYLDQYMSVGPNSRAGVETDYGLNENLAREILELHTLGRGYVQADVIGLARIMTGWTIDFRNITTVFRPRLQEPGSIELLGRKFYSDGDGSHRFVNALSMLAQSELTARHISRKIARHFLSDDPSPEVVSDLASAYQRSGGHLPEVYAALLSRPEVTAPLGKKARNGREFVLAAALRACTIPSKYWNGSSGVRLSMGALTSRPPALLGCSITEGVARREVLLVFSCFFGGKAKVYTFNSSTLH